MSAGAGVALAAGAGAGPVAVLAWTSVGASAPVTGAVPGAASGGPCDIGSGAGAASRAAVSAAPKLASAAAGPAAASGKSCAGSGAGAPGPGPSACVEASRATSRLAGAAGSCSASRRAWQRSHSPPAPMIPPHAQRSTDRLGASVAIDRASAALTARRRTPASAAAPSAASGSAFPPSPASRSALQRSHSPSAPIVPPQGQRSAARATVGRSMRATAALPCPCCIAVTARARCGGAKAAKSPGEAAADTALSTDATGAEIAVTAAGWRAASTSASRGLCDTWTRVREPDRRPVARPRPPADLASGARAACQRHTALISLRASVSAWGQSSPWDLPTYEA